MYTSVWEVTLHLASYEFLDVLVNHDIMNNYCYVDWIVY